MKKCTVCKQRKPLELFSKDRTRGDGCQCRCKECDKVYTNRRTHSATQLATRRRYHHKSFTSPLFRAKALIRGARGHARRNGLPFDLTPEWLAKKIEDGYCEISGLPLILRTGERERVHPRAPSLDRIKHGGGYTTENVRVVCWQVNMARGQYGDATLLEMAEALVRTISSQGEPMKGSQGSETRAKARRAKRLEAHRETCSVSKI